MSAFIVQNGKYVTTVKAGSKIRLFGNDAGINNNPEFLVKTSDGLEVLRARVGSNILANAWFDWTAPPPNDYTFYQDSADLHTPSKQVNFTSTGADSGSGDGSIDGGGIMDTVKPYLPWIAGAVLIMLVLAIFLRSKK